ncbi:hypothetical protein G6F56_012830 [Rhizopus delemar]|nr:hypothetical protein G6F56_012830 [Rhizopus delemar]
MKIIRPFIDTFQEEIEKGSDEGKQPTIFQHGTLPKIENDSSTLNAPSKPRLVAKYLRSPPSAGDITFPSSLHSRYPINSFFERRKNNLHCK